MDKTLRRKWRDICNIYLDAFVTKHGYEGAEWLCENPGTTLWAGDHFIDMAVIRYDIDNDIPEHKFVEWFAYDTEVRALDMPKTISYPNWCNDLGVRYTRAEIDAVKAAQARVEDAQRELDAEIDRLRSKPAML